jgi:hypothetical protein
MLPKAAIYQFQQPSWTFTGVVVVGVGTAAVLERKKSHYLALGVTRMIADLYAN